MVPEEPEHEHHPLIDRLGITAEQRAAVINVRSAALLEELGERCNKAVSTKLHGAYDVILLRVDTREDLDRIATAKSHLKSEGALWVFHPKADSADMKADDVRETAVAGGLIDSKTVHYTTTHTATQYVIPDHPRG